MTLQQSHDDAHHDLTWLTGALARALHARAGQCAAVLPALQRLAACDFIAAEVDDAPIPPQPAEVAAAAPAAVISGPSGQAPASASGTMGHAPARQWLPEAVVAALMQTEEVAMALAAALEHLRWRAFGPRVAVAEVAGPAGGLRCACSALRILLAAPGTRPPCPALRLPGAANDETPLLFVLSGAVHAQDVHGALRHVGNGEVLRTGSLAVQAEDGKPLLACLLRP